MKFSNLGLSYANCTFRCRTSFINGTVERKSSLGINESRNKTETKHWYDSRPSVQRRLSFPLYGSRAPDGRKHLSATLYRHLHTTRSVATDASTGNLYSILGVSPKATHKEIKTAYYNLSMTYHPDKNKNCDIAARKFREITAAYEVLGNFLNRKKYDRGIMTSEFDGVSQEEDKNEGRSSYESPRGKHYRSQVSVHMGRNTIYNFDEWTKEHYGETFAKKASQRIRYEEFKQRERSFEGEKNVESLIALIMFIMIAFMYAAASKSYDVPFSDDRHNGNIQPQLLSETDEQDMKQ